MTTCQNCHAADGVTYRLALRRTTATVCGACHASLSALGLVLVPERRAAEVTPIVERRQPAWLSRLTAREMAS